MDKKSYRKGCNLGKFLDFTELIALVALARSTKDVNVITGIKYGDGHREELDLIYNDSVNKKPLLIYIHGGGFISGVRKMRKYLCADYARAGYFVANLDYELAPVALFPYQFKQLFKAIEWLIDNADKYNLDLNRVVVAGESAGGYLSSYVAAIVKNKALYDTLGIDFKYKESFDVHAAIHLNGCFNAEKMADLNFPNMPIFIKSFFDKTCEEIKALSEDEKAILSPSEQIRNNYPPTVVGRSKMDGLDAESVYLLEVLKTNNIPHVEFMAGGLNSPHAWCLATFTKEGKRCLKITLDFLDEVLNQ